MAAIKYIKRTVALDGNSISEQLPASFFNSEASAHTFIIAAMRGGQPLTLSGAVSATFLNDNDAVVLVSGSIVDGAAVVTLSNPCYELSGRFTLTIDVAGATVYECQSRIKRRSSGTAYDPSGEISVAALSAEIAAMRTATAAANTAAAAANTARENIQTDLTTYVVHAEPFISDVTNYPDLNTAPMNSILQYGNTTNVANAPFSGPGYVMTLTCKQGLGYGAWQLALNAQNGQIFARYKWGANSWGGWLRLSYIHEVFRVTFGSTIFDLNSAEQNTIRRCPSGCTNAPANEGTVLTFGSTTDTGGQLYWERYGSAYVRTKWGTWGEWNQIITTANVNTYIKNKTNILSAFTNISCFGDSLTWSQVYTGASTSRQAYKPYPVILGELTGATVESLASTGYSAATWWAEYNQSIVAKPNQLVIIYLGNNGNLTDTLSTDAPTNVSYENYANTNTGCYAKIVAKALSVGARVLLVKCYATTATTNNVIEQIAERFGCGIVDNPILPAVYRTFPDGTGVNPVHYNDLGYSQFAENLIENCGQMSDTFMKYLIPN